MKKLYLIIILGTAISTNTYALEGNLVTCWQHHTEFAGRILSPSNDPSTLRTLCFEAHKAKPQQILNELNKNHQINDPNCWKGKREDLGGSEGGN